MSQSGKRRLRRWTLHLYRVGIFVLILVLIRQQHDWYLAQREGNLKRRLAPADVRSFFPRVASLSDWDAAHGGQNALDENCQRLGHVIQTTPESAKIYGFSGPTNSMIGFDSDGRILGIKILQSDDTREHLAEVRENTSFLQQWNGRSRDEAIAMRDFHIVSGATLTSTAIVEGITTRLGGEKKSRFPDEIEISEVQAHLPGAAAFEKVEKRPFLLGVIDAKGETLGFASRTSPHADHMTGYQGPTDLLIILNPEELVIGLSIRSSFDNEPYVSFLTEDEYFFNTFKGFDLHQIGELDIVEAGFDVVSGATKTSVTVTEGLIYSALEIARVREPVPTPPLVKLKLRDIGTCLVTTLGVLLATTRLRGRRRLRIAFQCLLVGYLGFINADMLSQALLAGWARSGIAWKVAPGLVILSVAALIIPAVTGRNVYCSHLCPFGAAQDLLHKRLPWKLAIKGALEKILSALPVVLLLWCLAVAIGHWPFSLVAIEPFDAFVWRVAGSATIAIAIVGLTASLFVNRAYCRYGCPTGTMLKFLRLGGSSADRFGKRDYIAAGFALIAIGMIVVSR